MLLLVAVKLVTGVLPPITPRREMAPPLTEKLNPPFTVPEEPRVIEAPKSFDQAEFPVKVIGALKSRVPSEVVVRMSLAML